MADIVYSLRKVQKGILEKDQVSTPVILRFNIGYSEEVNGKKVYKLFKMSTGVKVRPCDWTGKRVKKIRQLNHVKINTQLERLENAIKQSYSNFQLDHIKPSPEQLKEAVNEIIDPRKEDPILTQNEIKQEQETFTSFLTRFVSEITAGTRLHDSKKYSKGTCQIYRAFSNNITELQKKKRKKYNWDDFDQSFYNTYVRFLTVDKNYSPNTVGCNVKMLKAVLRVAREEDIHTSIKFEKKSFKVLRQKVQNIYLSSKELNRIEQVDLSNLPENYTTTRDVFLIGSYTGQRFSDYSRINKKMCTTYQGIEVISLTQQKTGTSVILPISHKLRTILEKYDFNVPKTYEQKINKRIKEIAKLSGITEEILRTRTKGGEQIEELIPKHQLVTTHTARRSACTNMYLAGIPTLDIMKISGHKSEREFLNYIKVTQQETAVSLSSHPYFK